MWTHKGKKQLRYHGVAADGQRVHMYFTPRKATYEKDSIIIWEIALIIGVKNKQANDWWAGRRNSKHNKITGRGSIAPLLLALKLLIDFAEHLPQNAEIHVNATDERRMNAYLYLGHYENWYWEPNEKYIFYRNPKYWEFTGDGQIKQRVVKNGL